MRNIPRTIFLVLFVWLGFLILQKSLCFVLWSKTIWSIFSGLPQLSKGCSSIDFNFQCQKQLSLSWTPKQRTLPLFPCVQTQYSTLQLFSSCRNTEVKLSVRGGWPALISSVQKCHLCSVSASWFYRSLICSIPLNPSLLALIFMVLF